MPKVHYNRERSHSSGKARVHTSPDRPVAPRRVPTSPGDGKQGTVTCPTCQAVVTTKRAEFSDKDSGIRQAVTRLISKHRFGGGRVGRQDNPCGGSLRVA